MKTNSVVSDEEFLLSKNIIPLKGVINQESARFVSSALIQLSKMNESKEITIHIDCVGGSVYDGETIMSVMDTIPNPIHCIVVGCAKSMALDILINADKRSAFSGAKFMAHNMSVTFKDAKFKARELIDYAETIKKDTARFLDLIERETNIDIEYFKGKIEHDDWDFDSREALRCGFIDNIIPTKEKKKREFKLPRFNGENFDVEVAESE